MMIKYLLTTALLLSGITVVSQEAKEASSEDKKKSWDVSTPALPFKEVTISTEEGTWMSVDVSPDGSTLVFDLLGDIYTMPASGGDATLIRGGHAYEVQPRFSPDGSKISFTSDAGGGDNIWVMSINGSDAKQVTEECCLVKRWELYFLQKTFDFSTLPRGRRNMDVSYLRRQRHPIDQKEK